MYVFKNGPNGVISLFLNVSFLMLLLFDAGNIKYLSKYYVFSKFSCT